MKINDVMFFSPAIKTEDLKIISDEKLLEAYKDRVLSWYIFPSKILNERKLGFASGLLLFSLIDALARYFIERNEMVDSRFKNFLMRYFYFEDNDAEVLYRNFRNGLVHQSQIKGKCFFSYEIESILFRDENIVMINPKLLYEKLVEIIDRIFVCEEINEVSFVKIIYRLKTDHELVR